MITYRAILHRIRVSSLATDLTNLLQEYASNGWELQHMDPPINTVILSSESPVPAQDRLIVFRRLESTLLVETD